MRMLLLSLTLLTGAAHAAEISFWSNFPDPTLRGRTYNLRADDYTNALRLRSAINSKELQITAFVKSCKPGSENWREEVKIFNRLRAENYAMMKELREIISRAR